MKHLNFLLSCMGICGVIASILVCSGCKKSERSAMKKVTIGSVAPDFSLPDETNALKTLSTLRGSKVALYFYPKDQTPGCTSQACSIRDTMSDLTKKGIQVWGISYDSPASHALFKEKYHLSFPLLSDSNKKVASLYGVKGLLFAKRITFLIDEHGIVVAIIKDIDVANHAQQILQAFENM